MCGVDILYPPHSHCYCCVFYGMVFYFVFVVFWGCYADMEGVHIVVLEGRRRWSPSIIPMINCLSLCCCISMYDTVLYFRYPFIESRGTFKGK